MFVNNDTVSKGMVKYASNLAKESIVDVTGKVYVPKEPVQGCSQSQASSLSLQTAAAWVYPTAADPLILLDIRAPGIRTACQECLHILAVDCLRLGRLVPLHTVQLWFDCWGLGVAALVI